MIWLLTGGSKRLQSYTGCVTQLDRVGKIGENCWTTRKKKLEKEKEKK